MKNLYLKIKWAIQDWYRRHFDDDGGCPYCEGGKCDRGYYG